MRGLGFNWGADCAGFLWIKDYESFDYSEDVFGNVINLIFDVIIWR